MKRYNHAQAIAREIQGLDAYPPDSLIRGQMAEEALNALLIQSLPAQLAQVFHWIVANDTPTTARDVADALKVAINHGSNILNELWQLGLLVRERQMNDSGSWYVYRLKS